MIVDQLKMTLNEESTWPHVQKIKDLVGADICLSDTLKKSVPRGGGEDSTTLKDCMLNNKN